MIAVIQIIQKATVIADGVLSGKCGAGLYILLGVEAGDDRTDADLLCAKIQKMRIFKDENDKMNRSLLDVHGDACVVSNFTLCANYKHGNRPDYLNSAPPLEAEALYNYFIDRMQESVPNVAHGKFGADMQTEMITDGPVTIVVRSSVLRKTPKA